MGFEVIVKQIVILGIAIVVGYAAAKTGYLDKELRHGISRIVVRITLPFLIITSLTKNELNAELMKNAGLVLLIGYISIAALYLISILIGRLMGLKGATRTIHSMLSTFGNVAFLGFPLIQAIYGETGLFYAVIYEVANDSLVWTLGVYLIARDSGETPAMGAKGTLKQLFNPNTIAFIVSLVMLVFRLRLPPILEESIAGIGGITFYLSMLFIGMTLTTVRLQDLYKRFGLYLIVAVKMLAFPLGLALLLRLMGLDALVAGAIILQVAMPSLTVTTMLANEYHSDVKYAAEGVFVTTIFSLATLPTVYYLFTKIFC